MARKRRTGGAGDTARYFSSEDGAHYRGHYQDLEPAIRRTKAIIHAEQAHSKKDNPMGRTYIGSVPWAVLIDWLNKNHYTIDQFARREGTIRPDFMKYFLSREYSKLHTQHTTTRKQSSQIVVPNYIGGDHGTDQLRRAKNGDSELA